MSPLPRDQLLIGDARQLLTKLPESSVDMVLTSPPYFRLRDYDVTGQLGLEDHVDSWVDELTLVLHGLRRVLKPTGSLWLNLGDSYATHPRQGAPRKSLLLAPERVVTSLVDSGWTLRNKIVWQKANPMPTSVTDRLACTWEYLYLLTPNPRYHFDLDAVRIPHVTAPVPPRSARQRATETWRGPNSNTVVGLDRLHARGVVGHHLGKNPGDVWRMASSSYRGAHHATFPIELARRAILAGCPPSGVVLDPFFGAGTTAVAAEQLGRDWRGIELNPAYAALALDRITRARTERSANPTRAAPTDQAA